MGTRVMNPAGEIVMIRTEIWSMLASIAAAFGWRFEEVGWDGSVNPLAMLQPLERALRNKRTTIALIQREALFARHICEESVVTNIEGFVSFLHRGLCHAGLSVR